MKMKKRLLYFAAFSACCLAAACSNDEPATDPDPVPAPDAASAYVVVGSADGAA